MGNQEWIKEWKNRENGKSANQKEKDFELYKAAEDEKWFTMKILLRVGATPDYVGEYGWTAYYCTLFMAKQLNNQEAKKVLEKFDQKWKNEIEKNWTIWMAKETYFKAAQIIH